MKKTLTYSFIFCLLSIGATAVYGNNPVTKVDKRITKTLPISNSGLLKIENSYGEINLKKWDKNEVQFDVEITAEGSSNERAQKSLDNIDIDFSGSGDMVSASTTIESSNGSWWSKGNHNVKYKIVYTVYAPSTVSLDLDMSYGDIEMESWSGQNTKIDLAYGNLNAMDINGSCHFDQSYGNMVMHNIGDLMIDIAYGDFNAVSMGEAKIESAYSDFKIQKAGDLDINGDYDDYILGDVGHVKLSGDYDDIEIESMLGLDVKSDYTDLKAGHVNGPIEVRADYGSYIINGLGSNVTGGSFKCDYLTVKMASERDYAIEVSASHTSVKLSDDWNVTHKDEEGSDIEVKANKGNSKALFTFNMEYCSLYFK